MGRSGRPAAGRGRPRHILWLVGEAVGGQERHTWFESDGHTQRLDLQFPAPPHRFQSPDDVTMTIQLDSAHTPEEYQVYLVSANLTRQ